MIPGNSISIRHIEKPMAAPDNRKKPGLEDYEIGGVGIENAASGITGYRWVCTVVGDSVMLQRDGLAAVTVMTRAGITDIAFAFTQNMQPTLAWTEAGGSLWLRWYDGSLPGYRVQQFGTGRCPRLAMDDKRDFMLNESDVIFAYIAGGALRYRQQRDAFGIERTLLTPVDDGTRLLRIGMGGLNLQFELDSPV